MGRAIEQENRIDRIDNQIRGIVSKVMILEERLNRLVVLMGKDSNEEKKSNKKATGDSGDSDSKSPSKSKRKSK